MPNAEIYSDVATPEQVLPENYNDSDILSEGSSAVSGIDAVTTPAAPALAPFAFVGRYVSVVTSKTIAKAEVAKIHGAGKSLVLVYEDEANDALGGAAVGAGKAAVARPILDAIGWPTTLPVYFAVDFSVTGNQPVVCMETITAFANGIGRPIGVYGDVNMCTYAHAHGVKYLWQFGAGRAPGLSIYQSYPPITVGGIPCDPDSAIVPNYGQWAPPAPTPPTYPKIDGQEIRPGMFWFDNLANTGAFLSSGTHKAGIPNPTVLNEIKAHKIPRKTLDPAQIVKLVTVKWGVL